MRLYAAYAAAAFVLMFGAVWGYVVFAPMAFMDDEYPRWQAKQTLLRSCQADAVAIIGDSRAAVDVLPRQLPVPAVNLALAGTSTVESFVTVERLIRCPVLPRLVLISISASHFSGPDTFWQKSALYRFLGSADLEDLRVQSARLHDWSMFTLDPPDDLPPEARIWLYASDFPSIYFPELVQNDVFLHFWRNRALYEAVMASRGQYFFHESDSGNDSIAPEGNLPRFTVLPILDAYFGRTLDLLAAHHVRAAFLPMPVNRATYDAISPTFRRGFDAYLRGVAAAHPGFLVPADTIPWVENRLIGDGLSHMNRAGATAFSRRLASCVEGLLGPVATTCAVSLQNME